MSTPKQFRCDILQCGKNFKSKFSLKRHTSLHKVKKEYKCKQCTKSFALLQYLSEHELIHSGTKPFRCQHEGCLESFRQRGKRSLH